MKEEQEIHLTKEYKQRIYKPLTYSIIIIVFRKKLVTYTQKNKLTTMWRVSEEIILIDLGFDCYIVNFYKEEKNASTRTMVHQRIFLLVKRWHPNFVS